MNRSLPGEQRPSEPSWPGPLPSAVGAPSQCGLLYVCAGTHTHVAAGWLPEGLSVR